MNPVARKTLYRYVVVPSWGIVGGVALISAVGVSIPEPLLFAPFALSLLFFGLPHGAVDHLVPGRLSGRGVSFRSVLGVVLLYALLSTAYLVAWYTTPVLAFGFFILLTWFHWGQGDLYSTEAFLWDATLKPKALKFLTVATRGGLPMLVPLLAFPEVYKEVAQSAVALFSDAAVAEWLFSPAFRGTVGVAYACITLFTLAWSCFAATPRHKRGWCLDALEVGILAAYFSMVPPIFSLGIYFSLWHAPRHVARLMLLDKNSEAFLVKGDFLPALKNFIRDSAPLTAAAVLLLVGLYLAVPGGIENATGLLALYLVLISVLTLPHVAVVTVMDLRQGLWR